MCLKSATSVWKEENRVCPPACVATCAGKARIFGDLDDPNSEISIMFKKYNPQPLNPDLNTRPRVFYITDPKNCPAELELGHKPKAKEVKPAGLANS